MHAVVSGSERVSGCCGWRRRTQVKGAAGVKERGGRGLMAAWKAGKIISLPWRSLYVVRWSKDKRPPTAKRHGGGHKEPENMRRDGRFESSNRHTHTRKSKKPRAQHGPSCQALDLIQKTYEWCTSRKLLGDGLSFPWYLLSLFQALHRIEMLMNNNNALLPAQLFPTPFPFPSCSMPRSRLLGR